MGDGTSKNTPGRGNCEKREKQDKAEGASGGSGEDRLPASYSAQVGHVPKLEPKVGILGACWVLNAGT